MRRVRCEWRPAVVAVVVMTILACGCGDGAPRESTPVEAPSKPMAEVTFIDIAAEAGLTLSTRGGNEDKHHLLESTGTGVALADYDGDGDEDIYLTTSQTTDEWMAGKRPRANALYRNDGGGTFDDVAEEAGVDLRAWSAGAYFADYDNDGDKDLFVTTWGPNVLYRNDGDGTFTDVTAEAGVAGAEDAWTSSAGFGDLDGDGDLDLYVVNYCVYDLWDPPLGGALCIWNGLAVYAGPRGFIGQPDMLYRNNGDGTFTDISHDSGIFRDVPFYGLGVVMSDLDDDGDLDIFVANDSVANFLFRNDGEMRFQEIGAFANVATNEDAKDQAGMGTDAADFNGDGLIDLIVTNFSHECNTVHRNEGNLFFTDATFEVGFRDSFLKLVWGVKFFDYDNDAWLDVYAANGHIYTEVDGEARLNTSYKQVNSLYRNLGGGKFEDVTEVSGPGLAIAECSRGVAVFDVDRDGDRDLLVTNLDSTPSLLRNDGGDRRSWVSFLLRGVRSNRDAVGARLTVETGDHVQVRDANPFGSYQSNSSYEVHFGLAEAETVDRLSIVWPSGESEELTDLPARMFYEITEGQGVTASVPAGAVLAP